MPGLEGRRSEGNSAVESAGGIPEARGREAGAGMPEVGEKFGGRVNRR